MKYCPNCGKEVSEDQDYCDKCGNSLEEDNNTQNNRTDSSKNESSDKEVKESNDGDGSNNNIDLNKSTLLKVGILALFLVGIGASFYSYTLTTEVEDLKSEINRLEDINQNKSQEISELENRTVQAKFVENKDQVKQSVKTVAGASDNVFVEVTDPVLEHSMYRMNVSQTTQTANGTQQQTLGVFVTLDGRYMVPIQRQFGQVVSPTDLQAAVQQVQTQQQESPDTNTSG